MTLRDTVAAQRLYLRWQWRRPRALLWPLFLATAGGVFSASTPGLTPNQIAELVLVAPAIAVAYRIALYATLPFWRRNFLRQQPGLGHTWLVELDELGCRAASQHQDTHTAWSRYVAWAESRTVILVYRNDALFQFVPLRAVDAEFLAIFHGLVAKLPRR